MSDTHGNTPAAWTAVTVAMAAFVVGGIGVMIPNMVVLWVGVALIPVAAILYAVMSRAGLGDTGH